MRTLKTVVVEAPLFCGNKFGLETASTFSHPKCERTYIKVLAKCLEPQTAQQIYEIRNPLCCQLRDLCRAGYLQRLEMTVSNGLPGRNPYYYQTTMAGRNLIVRALEVSCDKLTTACLKANDALLKNTIC